MTTIIVDDQDPRIVYAGAWTHNPSTPGAPQTEYDNTKSSTTSAGATATLSFTGTFIAVYGSQGSVDVYGQPVTTYTIDGVSAGTYQAPVITPGYFTVRTLFFQSGTLSNGDHTLIITNTNGTAPNEFVLDYIQYSGSSPSPSSSLPLPTTSPTSLIPVSTSTPTAVKEATSRVAVGPILGGVIGGLAFFLGVIVLWCFYSRRRASPPVDDDDSQSSPEDITPFGSWYSVATSQTSLPSPLYSHKPRDPFNPRTPLLSTTTNETPENMAGASLRVLRSDDVSAPPPQASGSGSRDNSDMRQPDNAPITIFQKISSAARRLSASREHPGRTTSLLPTTVTRHEDSGLRIMSSPPTVDLPPAYSRT